MIDPTTFQQTIHQNWANHFQCAPELLAQATTSWRPDPNYAGDKRIILWHVGAHTFALFDPALQTSSLNL